MKPSILFFTLVLYSCSWDASSTADGTAESQRWVKGDSAWTESWHLLEDSLLTYTFTNTASGASIPFVVPPLPLEMEDGSLVGLALGMDRQRQVFRVGADATGLEVWPLPDDVWLFFHDIAISRGAQYLAYVAQDRASGQMEAIVRDLQTGREVVRESGSGPCDCDVDRNHARWLSRSAYEISIHGLEGWVVVRGDVVKGEIDKEAVSSEPQWH